ncbi:MAG: O-acetyl-ADP-ribose deacetylase [Candidatus Bathyarchaeia archaeon]|nr:O-acetyl-ADP-ribose deacetylase [Candidatus Bathyarchaeota archaeon]
MEARIGGALIRIVQGDITEQDVDAIVNAANPSLMGGGGVDGAIHRRGGPAILEECKRIRRSRYPRGLPTGEAVITTGGQLKARHVIHTVGPIWRGGGAGEAELLAKAYRSSLRLAVENGLHSVAFPSISTGAYGYPVEEASRIALEAIKEFLEREDKLKEVRLVLYTREVYEAFKEEFRRVFKTGSAAEYSEGEL